MSEELEFPQREESAQTNPFERIGAGAQAYVDVRPQYPTAFLDSLAIDASTRVLDIGAGSGKLTAQLAHYTYELWALEPSADFREVLGLAVPQLSPDRIIASTAEDTGLPADSFDLLTYGQCWHWLVAEQASAEAARVLRCGGRVAVLFNQFDVSVPWVLQLSRIMRSGDVHRFDRPPTLGKAFTEPELNRTRWIDRLSVREVFALGTTRSSWIKSSEANRKRMRANLRWYLCDELGLDLETGVVEIPYHTLMWTASLR